MPAKAQSAAWWHPEMPKNCLKTLDATPQHVRGRWHDSITFFNLLRIIQQRPTSSPVLVTG
jgi:hypothetical protein